MTGTVGRPSRAIKVVKVSTTMDPLILHEAAFLRAYEAVPQGRRAQWLREQVLTGFLGRKSIPEAAAPPENIRQIDPVSALGVDNPRWSLPHRAVGPSEG